MNDAFIGIDLCFAKRKFLPISICTWCDGRLIPEALRQLPIQPPRGSGNAATLDQDQVQRFSDQATEYIIEACEILSLVPRRIAIDAPSSPRKEGTHRRAAEAAMDDAKISCFTTPTASEFEVIFKKVRQHLSKSGPENRIPHANQLWMSVGFQLFKVLNKVAPCIEVFPQATARMVDSGQIHKSKAGGVEAQLAMVARHTGWPVGLVDEPDFFDIAFAPAHDRLDAYLSAWVATLEKPDRVAFGSPPSDVIWTPRVSGVRYQKPLSTQIRTPKMSKQNPPTVTAELLRNCPACNQHQFKRWPLGWDAHASHRCTGLASEGTRTRKAEFKQKYGHLFKRQ